MKPTPNTQEAIEYDSLLIKKLVAENPAMVLAGSALYANRYFMASDILEASGLASKIEVLIKESVQFRDHIPATVAYVAHWQHQQQQLDGLVR